MAEEALRSVVPIVFGVLFLTALLTASGYLVQAVAADKESRVAEVLLACVTPEEILFGKLIGLGTAGLIQLVVWVALSSGGTVIAGTGLAIATGVVPLAAIAIAPVLFVAGYFFLGSLMLVTGALGSNAAEAQKLSVAWALLGVAPTFFLVSFMDAPHGTIPRVLSVIPTTAPLALMLRIGMDPGGVAWWEVPLALGEIALCTYVVLRIGARLFAFGLLRTTLPSLRELWAVLRG
jgi:ABC-2 type transport system permease protein